MHTPVHEKARLIRLNQLLAQAWQHNLFYREKWRDLKVPNCELRSVGELRKYPLTTRLELVEDQVAAPPFGKNLSCHLSEIKRFHCSSGTTRSPLLWCETSGTWQWLSYCSAELFRASGVQLTDRIFLVLNFKASLGPWAIFEGALALGCTAFTSATTDPTVALEFLRLIKPNVLVAAPEVLLKLADRAKESGLDPAKSGITRIISFGKNGWKIDAVKHHARSVWGVDCFDRYGMTEAGSIASECCAHSGMHVLETEFIVESIDPETLRSVGDGECGELVVTNLGRQARPIIRYRTGDLVRLVRHHNCPCGRKDALLVGGVSRRGEDTPAAMV